MLANSDGNVVKWLKDTSSPIYIFVEKQLDYVIVLFTYWLTWRISVPISLVLVSGGYGKGLECPTGSLSSKNTQRPGICGGRSRSDPERGNRP